jgi:hypothetical protein
MLSALFFDDTTFDRLGELAKIQLLSGTLEYYKLVDTCYTPVEDCVKAIKSYTGSESRIRALDEQIKAAEKLTPDPEYRNLLLAGTFYKQ